MGSYTYVVTKPDPKALFNGEQIYFSKFLYKPVTYGFFLRTNPTPAWIHSVMARAEKNYPHVKHLVIGEVKEENGWHPILTNVSAYGQLPFPAAFNDDGVANSQNTKTVGYIRRLGKKFEMSLTKPEQP